MRRSSWAAMHQMSAVSPRSAAAPCRAAPMLMWQAQLRRRMRRRTPARLAVQQRLHGRTQPRRCGCALVHLVGWVSGHVHGSIQHVCCHRGSRPLLRCFASMQASLSLAAWPFLQVPAPAAPPDLMALEDELLARAVAADSDASRCASAGWSCRMPAADCGAPARYCRAHIMKLRATHPCTWQGTARWRRAATCASLQPFCWCTQLHALPGTCSDAEAAVLQAGAALLGNAAASQDSGSTGPALQPVPAAAAPAAQLVLEVLQHLYLLHCWSLARHAARRSVPF